MSPLLGFDLYLITDGTGPRLRALAEVLNAVPKGRVAVQLRMPHQPIEVVREAAAPLRDLTRDHASLLLLNAEHATLAEELGVDGLQLSPRHALWKTGPASALGPGRSLLGVSCHNAGEIAVAEGWRADFVLLSPFGAVPGKGPALGVAEFATLAHCSRLPVVALGGLGPANAGEALKAGARSLAAIRGILGAADPARAACAMLDVVDAHARRPEAKTHT